MKNLVLLIMGKYKLPITICIGCLEFLLLGVHAFIGVDSFEYILSALIGYIFFVAVIWNVGFVYMPSIDEMSNGAAVFSRWMLILVSISLLLYLLFEPFVGRGIN